MGDAKRMLEEAKVRQLFEDEPSRVTARGIGNGMEDNAGEVGGGNATLPAGAANMERRLQAFKRHAAATRLKIETAGCQSNPRLVMACKEAMQKVVAMVNAEISSAVSADLAELKEGAAWARQQAETLGKRCANLARVCESLPYYVPALPGEAPGIAWSLGM